MAFKFIDLTHALHPNIPHWDIDCGFRNPVITDYSDCTTSTKFRVQALESKAGIGTHIDAPSHCIQNGKNVDEIEMAQLIVPCIMIDLSDKIRVDNYIVTVDDIINFENDYGVIFNNSFVIIRTGWDVHWDRPEKYHNGLIFPSISGDVAKYLIDKNIVGLGVDTLSPDTVNSGFPVHQIILKSNKYIIENVANSNQLPPTDSYVIILPMKIKNGTESPVRMIGCIKS